MEGTQESTKSWLFEGSCFDEATTDDRSSEKNLRNQCQNILKMEEKQHKSLTGYCLI